VVAATESEQARQLVRVGLEQYRRGEYDKAYEGFRAAWQLKQHFTILGDLAIAELKLGRRAQAANHLAEYLRIVPADHSKEREIASKQLDKLRPSLVSLTLQVNLGGAHIFVNGAPAGVSPLERELLVDPGGSNVTISHPSYGSVTEMVTASAGESRTLTLQLGREFIMTSAAGTPIALPHPVLEGGSEPLDTTLLMQPSSASLERRHVEARASARLGHTRKSSHAATTKRVLVWSGAGLGAAAFGVGAAFAVRAHNLRGQERTYQGEVDSQYGPQGCANGSNGAGSGLCSVVSRTSRDRATADVVSGGAFIAGAAFGLASLGTYLLWPIRTEHVAASAWFGRGSGGVRVAGKF